MQEQKVAIAPSNFRFQSYLEYCSGSRAGRFWRAACFDLFAGSLADELERVGRFVFLLV
ncbi:hypothetical protein [Paraburkholderia fynbosensis]|uniref:hypothetical protein n=1 Tax=Paraburkholderia fynbosensis TaxID=1200993 RepID=UPI0015829BE3|nr:hypothetical protein [Paraburkholderia fynbosensis]